jgi:hypothetical protein
MLDKSKSAIPSTTTGSVGSTKDRSHDLRMKMGKKNLEGGVEGYESVQCMSASQSLFVNNSFFCIYTPHHFTPPVDVAAKRESAKGTVTRSHSSFTLHHSQVYNCWIGSYFINIALDDMAYLYLSFFFAAETLR